MHAHASGENDRVYCTQFGRTRAARRAHLLMKATAAVIHFLLVTSNLRLSFPVGREKAGRERSRFQLLQPRPSGDLGSITRQWPHCHGIMQPDSLTGGSLFLPFLWPILCMSGCENASGPLGLLTRRRANETASVAVRRAIGMQDQYDCGPKTDDMITPEASLSIRGS